MYFHIIIIINSMITYNEMIEKNSKLLNIFFFFQSGSLNIRNCTFNVTMYCIVIRFRRANLFQKQIVFTDIVPLSC